MHGDGNGGNGDGRGKAGRAAQLHFDQVERAADALRRGIAERLTPTPAAKPQPIAEDKPQVAPAKVEPGREDE